MGLPAPPQLLSVLPPASVTVQIDGEPITFIHARANQFMVEGGQGFASSALVGALLKMEPTASIAWLLGALAGAQAARDERREDRLSEAASIQRRHEAVRKRSLSLSRTISGNIDAVVRDGPEELGNLKPLFRMGPKASVTGIYFLVKRENGRHRVMYVGQSRNLPTRVRAHARSGRVADYILFHPCAPADLELAERAWIWALKPAWNTVGVNNPSGKAVWDQYLEEQFGI
jgi:hypothetical protein